MEDWEPTPQPAAEEQETESEAGADSSYPGTSSPEEVIKALQTNSSSQQKTSSQTIPSSLYRRTTQDSNGSNDSERENEHYGSFNLTEEKVGARPANIPKPKPESPLKILQEERGKSNKKSTENCAALTPAPKSKSNNPTPTKQPTVEPTRVSRNFNAWTSNAFLDRHRSLKSNQSRPGLPKRRLAEITDSSDGEDSGRLGFRAFNCQPFSISATQAHESTSSVKARSKHSPQTLIHPPYPASVSKTSESSVKARPVKRAPSLKTDTVSSLQQNVRDNTEPLKVQKPSIDDSAINGSGSKTNKLPEVSRLGSALTMQTSSKPAVVTRTPLKIEKQLDITRQAIGFEHLLLTRLDMRNIREEQKNKS